MATARKEMEDALKVAIAAELRPAGFSGSFPHLRRRRNTRIDLLSFQFHSAGGSFVVEVAACGPNGVTSGTGADVEPSKVRASDISPMHRPRLGTSGVPEFGDHWFVFGPRGYEAGAKEVKRRGHYDAIAFEVIQLIQSQAEAFWAANETGQEGAPIARSRAATATPIGRYGAGRR